MSKETKYKKIVSKLDGSELWLPEKENEEIEGKVIFIADNKYGRQYVIESLKDKDVKFTTPSHAMLQNLMIDIKENDIVKIIYLGKAEGKEQEYNNYEIFKAE